MGAAGRCAVEALQDLGPRRQRASIGAARGSRVRTSPRHLDLHGTRTRQAQSTSLARSTRQARGPGRPLTTPQRRSKSDYNGISAAEMAIKSACSACWSGKMTIKSARNAIPDARRTLLGSILFVSCRNLHSASRNGDELPSQARTPRPGGSLGEKSDLTAQREQEKLREIQCTESDSRPAPGCGTPRVTTRYRPSRSPRVNNAMNSCPLRTWDLAGHHGPGGVLSCPGRAPPGAVSPPPRSGRRRRPRDWRRVRGSCRGRGRRAGRRRASGSRGVGRGGRPVGR